MGDGSLYARLLGDAFADLPPVLRRFHGQRGSACARGLVTVRTAPGRLSRLLASLGGLPRAGVDLPVELWIEPRGTRERWRRRFDRGWLVSDQWCEGALLAERFGPLVVLQRVCLVGQALTFESVGNRIGRLRLPGVGLIRVRAKAWARPGGWQIEVRVATPLGELTTYEGSMAPCR